MLVWSKIDGLDGRVSRLEGQMSLFIAFDAPILVGIIGTLLKNSLHVKPWFIDGHATHMNFTHNVLNKTLVYMS